MRGAKSVIDLHAIAHNYNVAKQMMLQKNPSGHVLAIVKANAYGHGAVQVARFLLKHCSSIDGFGVSSIEEALELRHGGIYNKIVLLEGFFTEEDELKLIDDYNFSIIIHSEDQVNSFIKYPFNRPVEIWLKLDSGMNRLGFTPSEFMKFYNLLSNNKNVSNIGKITHFAFADMLENPEHTLKQWDIFEKSVAHLPGPLSAGGSAIILGWLNTVCTDWLRAGIMLYGISPFLSKNKDSKTPESVNIKPAMKLVSTIISVKHVDKGQPIGYGGRYVATRDMKLGVVAMGYGDGFPRQVKDGCPILVNGVKAPIVGRVSMDMLTVDLSDIPDVKPGDEVIFWGTPELTVADIAKYCSDTSPYELVTKLTRRVPLQYTY